MNNPQRISGNTIGLTYQPASLCILVGCYDNFLSYNLLVLMGGPTFFNKRYDTVHIYKRGIHYTIIDDKEKFCISTGSFTPPLDILSG
jgi:hypothetical protein